MRIYRRFRLELTANEKFAGFKLSTTGLVRTTFLLEYIGDEELRRIIKAAQNKRYVAPITGYCGRLRQHHH